MGQGPHPLLGGCSWIPLKALQMQTVGEHPHLGPRFPGFPPAPAPTVVWRGRREGSGPPTPSADTSQESTRWAEASKDPLPLLWAPGVLLARPPPLLALSVANK